jgi:hypothetical protein
VLKSDGLEHSYRTDPPVTDPNQPQQPYQPGYQQPYQPYQAPPTGPVPTPTPYQEPAPGYYSAPLGGGAPQPPAPQPAGPRGRGGWPRSATITAAVLGVAVIALGVTVGVKGGGSADVAAGTVTVTATPSGGATVTTTAKTTVTTTRVSTVDRTPTAAATTSAATTAPEDDGPIVGKVGTALPLQWTEGGKVSATGSVTVNSAKRVAEFKGDYTTDTPKKGVYLVVDISYALETGSTDYNPYDWSVRDAEGHEYREAFVTQDDANEPLHSGTLTKGQKARGVIYFDIPKGAVTLEYSVGYGDAGAQWPIP